MKEFNDVAVPARGPAKPVSENKEVVAVEEQAAAIALGLAFLNAAGFEGKKPPEGWRDVTGHAAKWIDAGWSEQMIVVETKIIMDRITPASINYFEKPFAQAHADRNREMPVASPSLTGTARAIQPRRRGSISDAADELIAQAKAREAASSRSTGPAYTRLIERLEQDDDLH